jgi:acylphosphatase
MRQGYASIVRAPGACVHGILWRLTAADRAALDVYEDVAGGLYRAVTMRVVTDRGSIPALVYVGAAPLRGVPRPGYLELVMAAAREAGLPPRYIRDLALLASPADLCQQAQRKGAAAERVAMDNEPIEVKRLMIRGVVQGIGYRAWADREALLLGLKGWCRNRRDGSVEMVVGGPPAQMTEMIARCRKGPPLAKVDGIEIEDAVPLDMGLKRHSEPFSLLATK